MKKILKSAGFCFMVFSSSCSAIVDPILPEKKQETKPSEVHVMHRNCRVQLYINDKFVEVNHSENLKLDILKVRELKKVYCTIKGDKHAVVIKHKGREIDFKGSNIVSIEF